MQSDEDAKREFSGLVERISENLQADLILYSGAIDEPAQREFHELVRTEGKRRPNVALFLTTGGGSADVAYQIARCLQLSYKDGKIFIFVNTYCKSAGTLIATGADELVMSNEAEFGPLDVQVYKPDELGERISGLTPIQALTTLRREAFKTFEQYLIKIRVSSRFQITTMSAAEIAAKLTNGCFGPIFQQIDPMGLGEHQRAMMIASAYGERLDRGNLKPQALGRLIAGYPSHEYVIDRDEATELFNRVREPSPDEQKLMSLLEPLVEAGIQAQIKEEPAIVHFLSGEDSVEGYNADGGTNGQDNAGGGQISPPSGTDGGEAAGHNGSVDAVDRSAAPDTDSSAVDQDKQAVEAGDQTPKE